MKKIFSPVGLAVFFVINIVVNAIFLCFGYLFRPANMMVYAVLMLLAVVIFTVFSVRNRKDSSKISDIICTFLPIIALVFSLLNSTVRIDFREHRLFVLIILITSEVCSIILFFVCGRGGLLRGVIGLITSFMLAYAAFALFFAFTFGSISLNTVVKEKLSPDGKYTAKIIDSDQGALGGATFVDICYNDNINLLVGTLEREEMRLYYGMWGEFKNMSVEWESNDSLLINGKSYKVSE